MSTLEQRFIASIDSAPLASRDLQPVLAQLHGWREALERALAQHQLGVPGLQASSALATQYQAIIHGAEAAQAHWTAQWQALQPAQWLAQNFDDKLMLLVFGKFNAGKSSLCNFLAQRFTEQGHQAQYFHLEAGQIQPMQDVLREGATETTARLQGVCLGPRLVLLDTPGLHSATDANAALTQRFLDSADAVLWLTSSTSPGQVQALDELAQELRRGKPLLPILTRSDYLEEDEVDGEIVKQLRNKSAANRALQEEDVHTRAADKLRALELDLRQLKAPVSISAHVARTQLKDREQADSALREAGIDRLYAALLDIATPALAYKQRKPAEMLLHHLQEQVLGTLQQHTVPALTALQHAVQAERAALVTRQQQLVQHAWRDAVPAVPALLEQHAARRDVAAASAEVSALATAAFARQAQALLADYVLPPTPVVAITLPSGVTYEGTSADEGDEDGTAVGYDKLYSALTQSLREWLADLAARTISACDQQLQALEAAVLRYQQLLLVQQQRLQEITQHLREQPTQH